MNNSKYHNNFMTTVKQQLQQKNKRKYSNMKQQKNMTFYNLYKDKIITIQRWYRNCISKKVKKMEKTIIQKMKQRHQLLSLNQVKNQALKDISNKRAILMEGKESQFIAYLQQQIAQKLKKALCGTLNSAESLAEANSKANYLLKQIRECENRGEELQGEVEALKFEYSCHRKRKAEWQEKLFKIKENILNETLKTKDIKTKINQIVRGPLESFSSNRVH